jgi:uncharacterized membrane protein (UPF0127 family)
LEIAAGYWSRLIGLQFRRRLENGAGLLLVPCSSLHTCFVRFAIDVVFLDRDGCVLAVRSSLRTWRFAIGPRLSHATLEMPSGSVSVVIGERLKITSDSSGYQQRVPAAARFLER